MKVECKNCNIEFEKPNSEVKRSKSGNHFCSKSCAASFNNRGVKRHPRKTYACKTCKNKFENTNKYRSKIFCSKECKKGSYKVNDSSTLLEIQNMSSAVHKHPSWRNANVRHHCRSRNKKLLELACAVCNYSKHVELCHIKAIKDFDLSATLAEVNAKANVIQLCRNCHWEFDNGLLKLS